MRVRVCGWIVPGVATDGRFGLDCIGFDLMSNGRTLDLNGANPGDENGNCLGVWGIGK